MSTPGRERESLDSRPITQPKLLHASPMKPNNWLAMSAEERKEEKLPWEEYKAEVLRIAKEELGWSQFAIDSIPLDTWREFYYDEGYSPKEAWEEEYSNAL